MDSDTLWKHIDEQRIDLATLIESLSEEQLATPSLCAGWTVRDVAVHLTQSHAGARQVIPAAVRYGFRFNTMIREMAVRDQTPPPEAADKLRAMVGSRRHPFATNERAPLIDSLLHGQDIAVPLGIDRPMPVDAAAAAAQEIWDVAFPFFARRRNRGLRFDATDVDFAAGSGQVVEAPIRDILMCFSGRVPASALQPSDGSDSGSRAG
ncbi:maleylpyruvate isomerase family mycothiol-dependent enzyme [Gordonia rubripertincta]|uniref:Maleylpyruvate isomerase family mycothiol-dependent enzyme n=1 Tax=Gordonia rubripertincta TaxID=36822 RepID=A0AAW4G7V1_GORRU|nr:maleylpyruvate isomerase family mycothiol-dependent enzyme [Gordonia rubripertincta]MBM7279207.1 maleylpyruvate isomerase family mycothiol-dependent enzyme [Gordonia rubripertincta]QMU19999.1 maleylpyruvate isomerase family mycothiol-dependent enzyme [Gordonia rubripertincta]